MKTVSQRLAELNGMKFVEVRNLVHLIYKRPDNSPLLAHAESLQTPREKIKDLILQYEVEKGFIVNDVPGQEVQLPPPPQMEPVPQMTQPFNPQQPPMQQMVPQNGVPPIMQPQQMIPQQMAPQEQPAPQSPPGRKRRGPNSTAAAPPPPAPPEQMMQPMQTFTTQPMQVGGPVVPTQTAPLPFTPPQFQPAQVPQQAPQGAPVSVDLTPVMNEIQQLGKGLNSLGQITGKDIQEIKTTLNLLMAAIHHLYLSNPGTAPAVQGQANTVPDFRNFLAKYAGNP